jgi:flagellar hook protein FlgE
MGFFHVMSINSAMLAGVSGLLANSSSLAAISDNIANVNTVGYKRSSANFSSMVTSQSKNGSYSAGGVGAKTHQFISQQGLSQATTSSLDLSISGAGFFVTTEKPEGLTPTDTRSFTRAGSFTLDNLGYLQNDAGLYLQGWLADPVTGMITTDPSDLSRLSSINVATVGGAAEKTTRAGINANLRSEQTVSAAANAKVAKTAVPETPAATPPVDYAVTYSPTGSGNQYSVSVSRAGTVVSTGTATYDPTTGALVIGYVPTGSSTAVTTLTSGGQTVDLADLGMTTKADAVAAGAYDPATNSMSDYALDPTKGVKPDFEIQLPVSDSKGGQRTITLSLIKGPGPNEWYAELRAKPGDLDNNANGLISSGKITFTNDGKLASTGGLFGTTNPTSISIGASDPAATGRRSALGRRPGHRQPEHPDRPGQRRRRPDPVQQPVGGPVGQHQRHGVRQPDQYRDRRPGLCLGDLRQRRDPPHRPGGHRHLRQSGRAEGGQRQRLSGDQRKRRLQPQDAGRGRGGRSRRRRWRPRRWTCRPSSPA